MSGSGRPSAFIQLYISNCQNFAQANRQLKNALAKSNCRIHIIDYLDDRKGLSWVRVAVFGEVDENDLKSVFESQRARFRLESVEFTSGSDDNDAKDLHMNDIGKHLDVPCNSADESYFNRTARLLRVSSVSTEHDVWANATRHIQSWNSDPPTDTPKIPSQDMDQSFFLKQVELIRMQRGTRTVGEADDSVADKKLMRSISDQSLSAQNQERDQVMEEQIRQWTSASAREMEQKMKEQIQEWGGSKTEFTFADVVPEAHTTSGDASTSVSTLTQSDSHIPTVDVFEKYEYKPQRRREYFGNRRCMNGSSCCESVTWQPVLARNEIKDNQMNQKLFAEKEIPEKSTCETGKVHVGTGDEVNTMGDSHEKQNATAEHAEDESNSDESRASPEPVMECSIPPIRTCDAEPRKKEYGEPPDVYLTELWERYLNQMSSNSQLFAVENAGKARDKSSHAEYIPPPRGRRMEYPPPSCRWRVARGKFTAETRKLEKELTENAESGGEYQRDFLEREVIELLNSSNDTIRILKRKRRLEIFDGIGAKHLRILTESKSKSLPVSASLMDCEIDRFASGLPVYNIRLDIERILRSEETRVLVIVADTGTGKSTQIPQYLVYDGIVLPPQKILCTQPRRAAVEALAKRVAMETSKLDGVCLVNNPAVNDALKMKSSGMIHFVTEKRLLDYIQQDSKLSEFGCVIIDEAHERTVNTDMCLGMMKGVLRIRPDMKLVIASATVDPKTFLEYFAAFGAKKLELPGRQFPIEIRYESPQNEWAGITSLMRDYVDRTVDKVASICQEEAKKEPFCEYSWEENWGTHAAHIMAFLSNPLETAVAEERLRNRLVQLGHGVQVKIVTLYGNMSLEDRAEVFAALEPGYHHKVIFATNVGETSLTIPGVRYVVDCGLAKVRKFDVVRQTNVLELGLISKCAAKQRAGRAGRTAPGICYRLYSKEQYKKMSSMSVPDILLTNLAEVVLYMISVGITDPAEFDFIEKPNVCLLKQAEALLRSLNATALYGGTPFLTQKGAQMKMLPVEPRLAKMILDSVELGVMVETAVVCACIHFGSLFHRGKNQDKFILADQKKLAFCEESGDPMTFLAVFWQYLRTPKKQVKRWCFENYVNLKCMKSVFEMAWRICKTMQELGHANKTNIYDMDVEEARKHIPFLFCRSFGGNLAVYSGIPQRGYFDFREEKYVLIHPSSALKYSDITPEFIVYECSLRTSCDFVINVCAADPTFLKEIDASVVEDKRKSKLISYSVSCGTAMKRWIAMHMGSLQQEVGMECIRKRNFGDPYNRLQIYVAVKNLPKLEAFIKRTAEEKLDVICRKTREVPIMYSNYVLHMSGSGEPVEIIMPGEFCSLFVGREGIDWKGDTAAYRDELEKYFSKFGKITEFVTFGEELQKRTGHACLIRMENKEAAQRALNNNREKRCGLIIEPRVGRKFLGRVANCRSCAYRLLFTWYRRPSCGYGHVKLKSINLSQRVFVFDLFSKHLGQYQPSMVSEDFMEGDPEANIDDLFKITLKSLPLDIDNERLRGLVEPILDGYNIKYDDIYVVRKRAYPVDGEIMLEVHKKRIREYIIRVARNADITMMPLLNDAELKELNDNVYPFEVKIQVPKRDNDLEFFAHVFFSDMNVGMRVGAAIIEAMENGLFLEMGPLSHRHKVKVQQMFHYQMDVPRPLFDAVVGDLEEIYDRVDHKKIDFHYFARNCYTPYYVVISGGNFNAVNEVKAAVDKVIDGYTFTCRDGEKVDGTELPCHRLLSRDGRDYLCDLSQKHPIFLNISPYKMEVKVQGSVSNVEKAKTDIKRFLLEWSSADMKQVLILQPPDYRPGTLKALLAQNNYDLYSLEKKFGSGVHLDARITKRELRFAGKQSAYQQLLVLLRSISDNIPLPCLSETTDRESGIPECVVCLCAADPENYCLEACGHYVCKSCISMQLKTSIESREFPIVCVACEKPLTWFDLEALVLGDLDRDKNEDPQRLQSLADASLAYFMERHGDLYKHCSTPDCRGIHEVTKEPALGKCKLCGRIQCTRCGKEEHESMSCEEYARMRVNADESLRKWIREDQKRRRICPNPNCQAAIEKLGGCNHMQCVRCRQHFCWVCMFTAEESKDIYAHMEAEHGGPGADMHELMAAVENDPEIREFLQLRHPELLVRIHYHIDYVEGDKFDEGEFGELGAQWMMPDDELHDLFELQHEMNHLFDDIDETDVASEFEIEFRNDYEDDADIV